MAEPQLPVNTSGLAYRGQAVNLDDYPKKTSFPTLEQVGLRPARKGGLRVETEEVGVVLRRGNEGEKEVMVSVVHQYGHTGAGYQNSIGSANKGLELLQKLVQV